VRNTRCNAAYSRLDRSLVLPEIIEYGGTRWEAQTRIGNVEIFHTHGADRRGTKWEQMDEYAKILTASDWVIIDEDFLLLLAGVAHKNNPWKVTDYENINPTYGNLFWVIAKKQRRYAKNKNPRAAEITRSVFIVLFTQYGIDVMGAV